MHKFSSVILLTVVATCLAQFNRRPPPHRGHPPPHHMRGHPPPHHGNEGGKFGQNQGNFGPPNQQGGRFGQNQGNFGPPDQQGGQFGSNQGQFGGRRGGNIRGGQGGRGGNNNNNNIDNNVVEDGSGACQTFSQYTRQSATIWDTLGTKDLQSMRDKVLNLVKSGNCNAPARPTGQCSASRRKCDNERAGQKIESFYDESVFELEGRQYRLVITNGIPDHCYGVEEPRPTPNNVCESYSAMVIPVQPQFSSVFREHRMGPVGVAKSGAYMYNHKSAEPSCNVAALIEKPTFDPCDGHPDPTCTYHYHKAPVCIKGFNSCKLMGYIADGVPVYGKCVLTSNGQRLNMTSRYQLISGQNGCDASHYMYNSNKEGGVLDQANGYYFKSAAQSDDGSVQFPAGSYAYFFTPEYPFIMPGYFGNENYGLCNFYPDML